MNRSFLCILAALLLVTWGCGDDSMADTDGGDGTMDAGDTTTDGGGDGDDGGGDGDDAGPDFDAGDSMDGSLPGDDGGTTDDGGGTTGDAGIVGVDCMGMICSGSTPRCCITRDPSGTAMATCIASDGMCMGVTAACDGPEDCSTGELCCVGFDTTGGGGATCRTMCGAGERAACHDVMDCPASDGRMPMCCPFSGGGFTGSLCLPMCISTGP